MPTLYELIIVSIVLIICTITDIRTMTIPPWLCLVLIAVAAFEPGRDYANSLISALAGFIPLFILARIGNGGDGDALMFGAIGFTVPLVFALYLFLFTSILYTIVLGGVVIKTRDRKKQLPFVPFILAAWTILHVLHYTGVIF